ncbi:MAG: SDR family NAD(P)-dependent oxidoreductase [Porticoccaceae bacterium]
MNVNGQSVVITGGASGLGAGAARLFAERGAKLALFDWNIELARQTAAELGCVALHCDVADEASVQAAFIAAEAANGTPRILINCAGIDIPGRTVTRGGPQARDAFTRQIAVNLTGTFNICRLGADAMRELELVPNQTGGEERGVIVNVASIAGLDGPMGQTAYAASKAAVIGMTLPMARDLAPYGIRVVTIAPGVFNTPLAASVLRGNPEDFASVVPFPKRAGKPAEFAALALHICENSMLNGEVIRLDGSLRGT